VAVSQRVANQLITDYGIAKSKITVVANGHSPLNSSVHTKKKYQTVGFVGRLVHQKAPSIFLEIARGLASRLPDLKFIVVGDGYLKHDLMEALRHYNLQHLFTFHGFTTPAETQKIMSTFDLLVVPSVAEPFGLVALEAAEMGVPVVISKGSGVCEFIPSLQQVESWNVYEFVQKSEQLLTDEVFRKEVVSQSVKCAEKLTWENAAEKISTLYLNKV
jgi:glycosyltransferase involved in cell wall biosynthesis